MAEISKITLPSGNTYNIKDAGARSQIAQLTGGGIIYMIADELPTAQSETLGKIYLIANEHGANDCYDEFMTVEKESNVFSWEKIGSTAADFSQFAKPGDSVKLTGASAASAESGISLEDHTVTQGDVTAEASFVPQGSVSAPKLEVSLNREQIYIAKSKTSEGSVTAGTKGTAAECVLPVLTTSVSEETLIIDWTEGSFKANTPTTPTAVTMPTFSAKTLVTSLGYATAEAPVFTGEETTVTLNGKTSGVAVSAHSVNDSGHSHRLTGSGVIGQ